MTLNCSAAQLASLRMVASSPGLMQQAHCVSSAQRGRAAFCEQHAFCLLQEPPGHLPPHLASPALDLGWIRQKEDSDRTQQVLTISVAFVCWPLHGANLFCQASRDPGRSRGRKLAQRGGMPTQSSRAMLLPRARQSGTSPTRPQPDPQDLQICSSYSGGMEFRSFVH